ncbi:MAG: hypothetical protein ACFFAX_15850 [Promethearchaeota archaeon]
MSLENDFINFLKMEEELDLFSAKAGGVKFWERIRFQVFAAIIRRASAGAVHRTPFKSKFARLKRLLLSAFRFGRNPLIAPKADILFICTSRRFLEEDGLWWDIYSDPIIENLGSSSVAVETHFNDQHYSPAKTAGLRYFDYFEFMSFLKRRLGIVNVVLTESEAEVLEKIHREILKRFEFAMNIKSLTKRILEERAVRLPYYVKMLGKIQPKVVVMVQAYGREDIIEACKIQGVPCVELQHGVIHPQHLGYAFAGEFRLKEMFPDYLLVWGDHWKSGVEFPVDDGHIVSVGFPYLDKRRSEIAEVSERRQILFISQGIIGNILSRFAVALNKELGKEYTILYKLHPRECVGWREQYPELAASDVKVVDNPGERLHGLFPDCSIQIGVCSTAIYEGLVFGLQSYLVDAPCIEIMTSLLERGLATKVSTPEELVGFIKQNKKPKRHDVDYYFKVNALENIKTFLKDFIDSG